MKNLFLREKSISNNKGYCIQISLNKIYIYEFIRFKLNIITDTAYFDFYFSILGDIFKFNLCWSRKTDHAGFEIGLDILSLMINFNIYDGRHWDHDNDCWEDYTSYESLKRQGYTDEEIADAHILPSGLTPEEKKIADEEFGKFRMERLANMTEEEKELSKRMQEKFKNEYGSISAEQTHENNKKVGEEIKKWFNENKDNKEDN